MITLLREHWIALLVWVMIMVGMTHDYWQDRVSYTRKDRIRRRFGLARRRTWRMDYWLPRRTRALKWLRKFVQPNLLCPRCYGPTVRVPECMWRECEICCHHITEERIYGSMGTFRGTLWLITLGTRRRRTALPVAAWRGSGGVFDFMTDGKTIIGLRDAQGVCLPDAPQNRWWVQHFYGGAFYELNYVSSEDLASLYGTADRAGISLEPTPTREGVLAEYRRLEDLIEKYVWGGSSETDPRYLRNYHAKFPEE